MSTSNPLETSILICYLTNIWAECSWKLISEHRKDRWLPYSDDTIKSGAVAVSIVENLSRKNETVGPNLSGSQKRIEKKIRK